MRDQLAGHDCTAAAAGVQDARSSLVLLLLLDQPHLLQQMDIDGKLRAAPIADARLYKSMYVRLQSLSI